MLNEILVLTETNVPISKNDEYYVDGFNSELIIREGMRGGGIAVFLQTNISYKVIQVKPKNMKEYTPKLFTKQKKNIQTTQPKHCLFY